MSVNFRGAVERALIVGLVFGVGAGAIALAQQNESEDEGRVVQIGRADEQPSKPALPAPENPRGAQPGLPGLGDQQAEAPKYWIGLLGGAIPADHALRAHVDLPQEQGLLVADVVPDSPAAKAGLKKHDILLLANDTELRDMRDLVEIVRTEGEKQGQITLEIVRHGERDTVYLTPEERPAEAAFPQGNTGRGGGVFGGGLQLPEGLPQELLGQLEERGFPFDFRNLGPGVIVGGGGRGMANMPNGVAVSVQKEAGKPARVTVQRGGETWEVVGDDPESLKQLPEDLRPFVEQMLHGGSPLNLDLRMPNLEGLDGEGFEGRGFNNPRLQERLEQMERRMEELQRRLFNPEDRPAERDDDQTQ